MSQSLAILTGINWKFNATRGDKFFELSNHLGNVLATVSDKKLGQETGTPNGVAEFYIAQVQSATDYYPFGWEMPGRKFSSGEYRFGFNGKENDREWGGQLIQDYGFRLYNPAIGKFLSVDPLSSSFPMLTPYQFASNSPIWMIDIDGLEGLIATEDATTGIRTYTYNPNAPAGTANQMIINYGNGTNSGIIDITNPSDNNKLNRLRSDYNRRNSDVAQGILKGSYTTEYRIPIPSTPISEPELEKTPKSKPEENKPNKPILKNKPVRPAPVIIPPNPPTPPVKPTPTDPSTIAKNLCWWCYMGYIDTHWEEGIKATRDWLDANPSFNLQLTVDAGHTGNWFFYQEKWSDEITDEEPTFLGAPWGVTQIGVGDTYSERLDSAHKTFQDAVGKAYENRLIVKRGSSEKADRAIKMSPVERPK